MRIVVIAAATGLLASCVTEVKQDEDHTASGGVRAVFAPNSASPCDSQLPFPNDLARSRTTGLVNVPFCEDDSPEAIGLKTGLRTLDGFAITSPVNFQVTAPIDTGGTT